ncbi:MAG: hypothetical protein J6W38_04885 [Prevotella sp.]|nr:hypothetical protein [Prevotella sp.]
MNWKEKLKTVAEKLGLTSKLEDKSISPEELQQILDAYQKEYQVTLRDDMAAAQAEAARQQASEEQQQLLNQIYKAVVVAGGHEQPSSSEKPVTQQGLIEAINNLGTQIKTLSHQPEEDHTPQHQSAAVISINGFGNTSEYLFGIQHPMYAMTERWNKIAANPGMATVLGDPTEADTTAFRKALNMYGASLKKRAQYLFANKMTADLKALAEGQFSTDYAGVDGLGDMGTQFTVRRQDAIIARVLSTVNMTKFFPVRYGIQDNDVIFNAYFDEVSQAWQSGPIYKGGMKIENERGYVDDAMIKMMWGPMKELERKYIAYLNTSGSDPIKWTMIEYQLLNSLLQAQREQNIRRMRGIYVKPETGVAGSYLHTSTGILYRLIDYIHANRLLVTEDEDKTYRAYTESTMLAAVKSFVSDVVSHLGEDEDLSQKVLYLNERHKPWWLKCIRTQFHLDTDFSGVNSYANIVPDTDVRIIWLPYLGNLCFMMIHEPGNLQFLEFLPGEMMGLQMEQQMEMVRAWSTWKEGTAAAYLGKRFTSRSDLVANDYAYQQIFLNKFCKSLSADATKADAKNGFWFETVANEGTTSGEGQNAVTTPPALTDIENAKAGVAYIIECGSTTNATTIAKSGKFSEISANWTPSAVGDYLMVVLNVAGTKFLELERCVDGVRTISQTLNPHYVG